jgi:S1-C subfamily serine protease
MINVVKDATKVRLLTGAGLIDAKVVQVDAANDLALLKAVGRFAPLPICRQSHGASGRHGGDGRFSRHRFAGVRAQAGPVK